MVDKTPDLILQIATEIGDRHKKEIRWGQIGALYVNPEGEGFTGYIELLPGQRSKIAAIPARDQD